MFDTDPMYEKAMQPEPAPEPEEPEPEPEPETPESDDDAARVYAFKRDYP
jgi:hypothetical protein